MMPRVEAGQLDVAWTPLEPRTNARVSQAEGAPCPAAVWAIISKSSGRGQSVSCPKGQSGASMAARRTVAYRSVRMKRWIALVIAEGLELSLDPSRSEISPSQAQQRVSDISRVHSAVKKARPQLQRSNDAA